MNYTGEYTGPYWSNGEFQTSVEWGDKDPQSQLDWLSRQHDSAYAHYEDRRHREAADLLYMREAKKLVGQFPELAGNLVGYGNYTGRQIGKLFSDVGLATKLTGTPLFGVLKFGIDNIIDSGKRLNGTYLEDEMNDVREYYKTDPYKKVMPNPSNIKVKGSLEKVKAPSTKTVQMLDGQRREARIPGRIVKSDPNIREVIAAPLNAPRDTGTVGGKMTSHISQFLRRKKKNKIHVESPEERIQRLALNQKRLFDIYENKNKNAKASKPKNKNKAFGFDRTHKIMVKAKRDK